jgi:xylulokinase
MSLLGLDVGTTGCKAIVFDTSSKVLGQGYREYPLIHRQPGWVELDSDLVWRSTKEAIAESVAAAPRRDPVKALAISCLGEAVTPIAADGQALALSTVGFDNRAHEQSRWWEETMGKEALFQITGQPLNLIYTINKIMWWRDNQPRVFEGAWKFLCYGDLTAYRLGAEPVIDFSMAGRTMAFDVRAGRWSREILEKAGLGEDRLPRAEPSGTIIGEVSDPVADELGLPRGVKIVTGAHDQPAGALGAGITRPRIAMDATGTVECITPAFAQPVLTEPMLRYNYPCYPHAVRGMFVTLSFNFTGGSLLRWYRDVLGKQEVDESEVAGLDVYEIMIGKATSGPSPLLVLPHFTVTGTPWMDAQAKGAILGLLLSTTKGDFIKGLLDGLTYEMRLNLDCLQQAGVQIDVLRAIGGGAKSRTWLQLKADIFNRPVCSLSVSEAACLGVALLAGTAIGEYSSIEEAAEATVKVIETFEPDPKMVPRYEERYRLYREIYPLLSGFLHRM